MTSCCIHSLEMFALEKNKVACSRILCQAGICQKSLHANTGFLARSIGHVVTRRLKRLRRKPMSDGPKDLGCHGFWACPVWASDPMT